MPYNSTWNNPYMAQAVTPQYAAYQPTITQPYQQPVNGITKVNGSASALQYQLPPNSQSPALFDNNGKTFYVVSTDGTGMKTIEAFDYFPHKEEKPVTIDGAQFVSRKEFDDFAAKVNAVIGVRGNGVYEPVPATNVSTVGAKHEDVDASADVARRPVRATERTDAV